LIKTTNITYVTLETENGSITIELLDDSKNRTNNHVVEIKGVNYDIFAVPLSHSESFSD
jgi:hypothetical protein